MSPTGAALLARFGRAAYTLVRGGVISSSCHFSKEKRMDSKRTSRRELLKGGAALAGGLTLTAGGVAPALGQTHDHSMAAGGSPNDSPIIPGRQGLIA